jgi:uncharacterized RDD family membrane protein YckC
MDDQFIVDTPEHVAFGYEVAGIGSRFLAALVDTLIIGVLYLLIQVLILTTNLLGEQVFNTAGTGLNSFFLMLLTVLAFGVLWGYYIFFETLWHGQTPGKRLGRLRVIRETGGAIGLWEAMIRNLVRLIDFLPMAYGFGVVTMFANSRARRLGDYAAGTVVVREGAPVTLSQLVARGAVGARRDPTAPAHPLTLYMDIRRLSPADLGLVRELLLRLPTLPPERGWQLAWQMTQLIVARTGFTGQVHDPSAFLTAVVQAATGEEVLPA